MKTKYALVAVSLSLMTANVAANEENSWYVGLSANSTDLDSIETQSTDQVANVTRRIGIDTDEDTGFGLTVGKTLFTQDNGNKLSVELNYHEASFDLEELRFMNNVFSTADGRASGGTDVETLQIRAKYEFNFGAFKPYVGVGFGQSDLEVEALYGMSVGSTFTSVPPFADGSDSASSVELRAGLEYQITDSFGGFIEYAQTDVDDIQFSRRGGGPGGLATTTQRGDFEYDSINVGINYKF